LTPAWKTPSGKTRWPPRPLRLVAHAARSARAVQEERISHDIARHSRRGSMASRHSHSRRARRNKPGARATLPAAKSRKRPRQCRCGHRRVEVRGEQYSCVGLPIATTTTSAFAARMLATTSSVLSLVR
jgi:hypothetical protein